jgi:ABC-type spermidine/putrescine transport system permease subunit I
MHAIIMVVLMAVLCIVLCIELNTYIVVVGTSTDYACIIISVSPSQTGEYIRMMMMIIIMRRKGIF